jgi:hypothetical protein
MKIEIRIGSVAAAKCSTEACFIGEVGVCYGISDFEGHKVYGFVFETGRFIVLTSDDAAQALSIPGRICEAVSDYTFAGDAQLKADFRAGRFTPAFPLPWRWLH